MFVYKIRVNSNRCASGPDHEAILSAQLDRCMLKVGQRVRFKKPKRSPQSGIITKIEEDINKVEWRGMSPLNIHVDVGTQTIATSFKRLIAANH